MSKKEILLKLMDEEDIDPDEFLKELLIERPSGRSRGGVYKDLWDLFLFMEMYEKKVEKKVEPLKKELQKLYEELEKHKEDPVEKKLRMKLYEKVLEFMDKFSSFAEAFINLLSPFSFGSNEKSNKGETKVDVEIY